MSNLAVNDAGDVLVYDGQGWKPAPMAANDAGDKVVFDGTAWKPHAELVGAAKGAQPQGRSDALANAIGGGALQQFGDEATAAVRAAAPGLSNFMMRGPALQRDESIGGSPTPQTVSTAPTYGERYTEELARQRAQTGADAKAYPAMTTAGNIGGSVGSLALALPAALPAGGGLLANTARAALTGSIFGGASGFGEGEGGFDNRMLNATKGAAVGGVLGGAIPGIAKALGYAYSKAAPPILNKISDVAEQFVPKVMPKSVSAAAPDGGQVAGDSFATRIADTTRAAAGNVEGDAALARIALELSRSGGTRKAENRLSELGDSAFLADTSKGVQRLANLGNIMTGEAPDKYAAAFAQRDRNTGNRLVSAFEGGEPPQTSFALRGAGQEYDRNLRAVGANAYGAMTEAGLKQTPELMAIYENPHVAAAIDRVMATEKATRIGTNRAPASPVEIMHKVKQAIWDLGFDKDTARPGPMASWYRDLGIEYMNRLKAANPMLAAADSRYAQAASLPEHFDAGRSLLTRGSSEKATDASAPALADLLARADPQQASAARAGATNAARETALEGTRPARALAQRIDESAPLQDKLIQLYGTARADQIIRQAASERAFAETSNKVLHGSDTAQRMASLADEAALSIPQGRASPIGIVQALLNQYAKLRQPNEAVRGKIADLIANPQAAENAQTLALVEALLRRQSETRNFSSGAVGGAGGSQAGSP